MKLKSLQVFFRNAFVAVLGISLLSLLAACGESEETTSEDGEVLRVVRIGHVGPLTGPIAHLGKDNENGVKLALEEANAAGLVIGGKKTRFEMVSEDDEGNPQKGTVVAQKIVDADVAGVIGHLNSGTTIPASKIYFDAGIAQISPSATNVDYTKQGYKTAFRVMANDAQQGAVLGDFAVKKLNAKRIAVIDDRSAYGKGLADQFEIAAKAAGGEVITREFTDMTKTDFTAILTRIKGMSPELVFCGCLDSQTGPMMKQFRNLGLMAIFLSGDGSQTKQFLTLAGDSAEGAYASSPGVPLDKMPGGPAFTEKYKDTFKQEIQLYAPYAYDAANTLIAAIQQADSTDPEVYLPILANIQHEGVSGNVRFDEKGDIKGGSISLYKVADGEWEYIETVGGGS
ncbi:MAG: branched-chain amino acid ABC transporter substrate-binding protein [Betaproteobacteria bacterium]|jgi:branched-chain amino acid transport system substrate-binding protein|nr:MAG: branched-chain amino acid ABC transporter substrate-binding protein [Betaproteobacteria bacterium]